MQINKLTLTNFQLFKKSEICFSKVNLITGINHDDLQDSGNGSGKTTILNGVLFALYGVVTNLNIADLIKIGSKTASVKLECSLGKDAIRVVRTIPSSLKIFVNDEEMKFNTLTIAQKYIDDLFGDVNNFKMYRMMDNTKGINLLDLGVVSLRKNLMQFVDTYFSKIRLNLCQEE
jgi:DNA repair exonuclease SbcCD ATPase subunit